MIDLLSFDVDLDYIIEYLQKFLVLVLSGHVTFQDALSFTAVSFYIIISSSIGIVYWFLEGKMYKRILTMRGIEKPDLVYVPYIREFVLSKIVNENGKVRLLGRFYGSINIVKISGILDDIFGFILGVTIPRIILSLTIYGHILSTIYTSLAINKSKKQVVLGYVFSLFALPRIIYFWILYKKYHKYKFNAENIQ